MDEIYVGNLTVGRQRELLRDAGFWETERESRLWFEVPSDVVDQVYGVDPNSTFVDNLRTIIEKAARYENLCR